MSRASAQLATSHYFDISAARKDFGYEAEVSKEAGMDRLAAEMGEEGEYAVFVGSLGSKTHNEWADGGIAQQEEAYPNMVMVGDKNESFDDSEIAYQKAKEILAERQVLLVLDNFEHLSKAAGEVGELLTAAPRAKVVVTSRSSLELTGDAHIADDFQQSVRANMRFIRTGIFGYI